MLILKIVYLLGMNIRGHAMIVDSKLYTCLLFLWSLLFYLQIVWIQESSWYTKFWNLVFFFFTCLNTSPTSKAINNAWNKALLNCLIVDFDFWFHFFIFLCFYLYFSFYSLGVHLVCAHWVVHLYSSNDLFVLCIKLHLSPIFMFVLYTY